MDDIWIFNVISSGDQNCWWKTRVFEDIKIKQKFSKFIAYKKVDRFKNFWSKNPKLRHRR